MRYWSMFCAICVALLLILLLAMSPGMSIVSPSAHADSLLTLDTRPEQIVGNAIFVPVMPTTCYTAITPGAAWATAIAGKVHPTRRVRWVRG